MPDACQYLAQVRRADLDTFRDEVLDDGGRIGRVFEADGMVHVEVLDLRHHEVLAAGAISAHPVTALAPGYSGRRVRKLGPARKAAARRREQVADLRRELHALRDHAAEVALYLNVIEAGTDVRWKDLPPQVGWWLDGFDGRGPWHDRGGRPGVAGVHDVLQRRRERREASESAANPPPLRLV